MSAYWGYHLALDISNCDHAAITSFENINNFAIELVKRIDMVAYGAPQLIKFGQGDLAGITLIQLIETSNIMAHFVDVDNTCYLDVFSCKEFDPAIVKKTIFDYFKTSTMKTHYFERQA